MEGRQDKEAPWLAIISREMDIRQHSFLVKMVPIRHNLAIYGLLSFHDFR